MVPKCCSIPYSFKCWFKEKQLLAKLLILQFGHLIERFYLYDCSRNVYPSFFLYFQYLQEHCFHGVLSCMIASNFHSAASVRGCHMVSRLNAPIYLGLGPSPLMQPGEQPSGGNAEYASIKYCFLFWTSWYIFVFNCLFKLIGFNMDSQYNVNVNVFLIFLCSKPVFAKQLMKYFKTLVLVSDTA